ncbi:MAG: threonylcarbamoyl-AMP synthase [Lachnospiraceae bacterium]|nr:threonylcarbamoyl-AMP synthase [Lachnospiraceae bacterium]
MQTKLRPYLDTNCDENDILMKEAGDIIKEGGLVAFPTETVYGLGANALDTDAAKKIYEAKGRPSDNPLIAHIADKEQVYVLAKNVSEEAEKLMEKFWPGPLTLIFEKQDIVPSGVTGGLNTVAIRMPDNQIALKLIRSAGVPIAAPSANSSGRPSPTLAGHVMEDMDGRIDMVIDGGQVDIGIESTIVDMSGEKPMILRPGFITKPMLEEVVGEVLVDKITVIKDKSQLEADYRPKAPGMKYRHYAPKAEFIMFEGDISKVVEHINELSKLNMEKGLKTGVIATDETISKYENAMVVSIGSRTIRETVAKNLYKVLRDFDSMEVDIIYGETFYDDELGAAIMNRLIKAAGYRIEEV